MADLRLSGVSRIGGFYKYPVSERLRLLYERGVLEEADYRTLINQGHRLDAESADRLVENVIGVFCLPLGVGLNLVVNGKDYVVPMVVEEPSILAAVSASAKVCREGGGFHARSTDAILIGQIQVVGCPQVLMARNAILQAKQEILNLANSLHPRMAARGGGAREVEVRIHAGAVGQSGPTGDMLIVHVLVDTCDAMGANMVNSMCEGIAPLIEQITGGQVFLRILSNLTDRAMVNVRVSIPPAILGNGRYSGEQVRDGIVLASDFAARDPYRAATHNKGIMNGIDAVAIATGNDWRAIEAAAHAYAGRGESYTSLSRWSCNAQGHLEGVLEMPLKVGIVGGPVQSNPAVQIAHRLLRLESARELAELMGAVGLAQNLGALRALSTEGIQRGHMSLHARTVAAASGVPSELFDQVVNGLIESGDVKIWKAQELVASLASPMPRVEAGRLEPLPAANNHPTEDLNYASAHGKVILLGEHAVVYGARAVAAPIALAVQAQCLERESGGVQLVIPRWGVDQHLPEQGEPRDYLQKSIDLILRKLELRNRHLRLEIFPHVPRAMGLGSSAALAVAGIRALDRCFQLGLNNVQVNALAFECEKLFHGTPSGIDNSVATFGHMMVFRKGDPPECTTLKAPRALPMVIGVTGRESLTSTTVARVRQGRDRNPALYDKFIQEIDGLSAEAVSAIGRYDLESLGILMNFNHGLLNALQVSSPELEHLVSLARNNGALGAKLTGGGGGGSMIALCPDDGDEVASRVAAAMREKGYQALIVKIG